MSHILGYARVSTTGQDLEAQRQRLNASGAVRLFEDVVSGRSFDRPGLSSLLDYARPGDRICVVRLDRLGRSLRQLLETVETLKARGVGLMSLEEKIDTSSAAGELVFHVFGAIDFGENARRPRGSESTRQADWAAISRYGKTRCRLKTCRRGPNPCPGLATSWSGTLNPLSRITNPWAATESRGNMQNLMTVAFEAHHAERNHHRRYEITIGRDLLDAWVLSIYYGRTGQRGHEQHFAEANADELRSMIRERLVRRLSAPRRIGCPYRLKEFSAADGFDPHAWLPGEIMESFS